MSGGYDKAKAASCIVSAPRSQALLQRYGWEKDNNLKFFFNL